jgi:hypothetical protein
MSTRKSIFLKMLPGKRPRGGAGQAPGCALDGREIVKQQLAKRPASCLRKLKPGDRIRWRMPFVDSVWTGSVSGVNCETFSVEWDQGESGTFEFANRLVWNLQKIE